MREILFRGKSLDNGKWESGYLLENQGRTFIYQATNDNGRISVAAVEVDPATVGQYTGVIDEHGTDIYEVGYCVAFLKQICRRRIRLFGKHRRNRPETFTLLCCFME